MRKLSVLLFVVFLCVATLPAFGAINIYLDPQVGDRVSFSGHGNAVFYYNGQGYYGGPFTGTLNNTTEWSTFCVEADGGEELINLGTSYKVLNLDPHIATASQNYVTDMAKLLYWEYGHNALPNTGTVDDLQLAIWHGVSVGGQTGPPLTMYTAGGANAYLSDQAAQDLYSSAVTALTSPTTKAQAQTEADSIWVLNPADLGYSGTGLTGPKPAIRGDTRAGQHRCMVVIYGVRGLVGNVDMATAVT